MKTKILNLIAIGLIFASCGTNNNQTTDENTQKILTDNAFVTLYSYEYIDNTNGDFSGGSKDGRTIIIHGSTNFPDGTVIDIQTNAFVASSKEDGMTDTYAEVKVEEGQFYATLNPWNITEQIEFRIFADKQSQTIQEIIGKTGEKIKIDQSNKDEFPEIVIFQSKDYKVNDDIISKIKGVIPSVYTFQKSSEFSKPYEKTLAEFIKDWKDKDWNSMVKHCQSSENKTAEDLKSYFGMIDVLGFQVTSSIEGVKLPSGSILMEVDFILEIKNSIGTKGIQKKNLKANVIQENNKWGVNSTSVTGGLYK